MESNTKTTTGAHASSVKIRDVELFLTDPADLNFPWVGQRDVLNQLLACWTVLDPLDYPLSPRLVGKPGVGKTTLAINAAKMIQREVYLFQATMDTRPEDLIISPVIAAGNNIRYMASSIITAMIRGAVVILDEGNRMSERSWASLAPLLDRRRYVESVIAGVRIPAHPDFRFVTTMNEDASTYDLPEYIHSRLQPKIFIDFPDRDDEFRILKQNMPFVEDDIINYVVDFLQRAHDRDLPYSVRDGINIGRYAARLIRSFNFTMSGALDLAFRKILEETFDEDE